MGSKFKLTLHYSAAALDVSLRLRHHRMMETRCAQCGAVMTCQPEGGCWCADLPQCVPLSPDAKRCLCKNCLLAKIESLRKVDEVRS